MSTDQTDPTLCSISSQAMEDFPLPLKRLWQTPVADDAVDRKKGKMNSRGEPKLSAQVLFAPSDFLRSTPMPAPSSTIGGPMSPTSDPFSQSPEIVSLRDAVSSRLSSLVDFLASRTARPGSGEPPTMSATSGPSAGECFATYDPASRSSRTSPACSLLSQDFFSTAFCQTWPRFGTLVNGKLYRQPTLARPTDGIGSGSSASMNWPTARAEDSEQVRPSPARRALGIADTLTAAVQKDWPTPTAAEGSKIGSQANYGQMGLSNHPAIVGEPTRPKGEKSRAGPPRTASGPPDPANGSMSGNAAEPSADSRGKLRAEWVEMLQGLPRGWTST